MEVTVVSKDLQPGYPTPTSLHEDVSTYSNTSRFPRIILKDAVGRELDTESVYQRAISETKWRAHHGQQSEKPEEWRLPHDFVPARPDFSRVVAHGPKRKGRRKRHERHVTYPASLQDFETGDMSYLPSSVSFQSLNTLPSIASFADIRGQSASQKAFLQIVETATLHNKELTETEVREKPYVHPGVCSLCSRLVYDNKFCASCRGERHMYHKHDTWQSGLKPLRTGGGYTFFKRHFPSLGPEAVYERQREIEAAENRRLAQVREEIESPTNVFYEGVEYPDIDKYGVTINVNKMEQETTRSQAHRLPKKKKKRPTVPIKIPDQPREKLYHAPKAFQLQQNTKAGTVAEDPFSKDRQFNLPKGDGLDIKKSDKALTEFEDFRHKDVKLKDLKKFELKKPDFKATEHWQPTRRKDAPKKLKRRQKAASVEQIAAYPVSDEEPRVEKIHTPKTPLSVPVSPQKSVPEEPPMTPDSGVESTPDVDFDHFPSASPSIPYRSSSDYTPTLPPPDTPHSPTPEPENEEPQPRTPTPEMTPPQTPPPRTPTPGTPPPPPKPQVVVPKLLKTVSKPAERKKPAQKFKVKPLAIPSARKKEATPPPKSPTPPPSPPPKEPTPAPREPTPPPPPSPTPTPPLRELTMTPVMSPTPEPAMSPEMSFIRVPDSPDVEIEPPTPPPMVRTPTPPPPPPKPKKKKLPKMKRKTPHVVAPLTRKDLEQMSDPLDYLAKYCIIHPERLPFYELIFNDTISKQDERYTTVPPTKFSHEFNEKYGLVLEETADKKGSDKKDDDADSGIFGDTPEVENIRFKNMTMLKRARSFDDLIGHREEDLLTDKYDFTMEAMNQRYRKLITKKLTLSSHKKKFIFNLIKQDLPDLMKPDYESFASTPKTGKRDENPVFINNIGKDAEKPKKVKLTADDIIGRLDGKMWSKIKGMPELVKMDAELDIIERKLKELEGRMNMTEDEKRKLEAFSRDAYLKDQLAKRRPAEFRRQQSTLYNKVNPIPDVEMNLSEVEDALIRINGELLTDREYQYIYHVLNLPNKHKRLNIKLFSAVAALSEKVKQVDPMIRKLINKFNFQALEVKMEKCKELFFLLEDNDNVLDGKITADMLAVELAAGGISPEHVDYIINKFNRDQDGMVEFLDFLIYVPLFIEIHQRIISNPLSLDREF